MSICESIWDEVDEMPTTFEGKKALSESFLKRAIQGLLIESRERKVLTAPYGRPVQPTPLLNLSEFLKCGGLEETSDGGVADDPVFSYDYGFDPLQYLANYVKFLHPSNIRSMKDKRVEVVDRLRFRAAHANNVLNNCEDLKILTEKVRSGVLWGPFTSPSTSSTPAMTAAVCACRVIKEGDLIVQISKDEAFTQIDNTWTQSVKDKTSTQKLTLTDLEPGVKYYVRCCLSDPIVPPLNLEMGPRGQIPQQPVIEEIIVEKVFRGVVDGFFQYTQFITCPSDDDSAGEDASPNAMSSNAPVTVDSVKIVALNVSSTYMAVNSMLDEDSTNGANGCIVSCLMGGVFSVPDGENNDPESDHSAFYRRKCFDMHRFSDSFVTPSSVLRNSSMLLAWHDRSIDSDLRLNEEEIALKQFSHDMKKYQSKYSKSKMNKNKQRAPGSAPETIPPPPKLRRQKITPELVEVLQALPVDSDVSERAEGQEESRESAIRQIYSTSMLGPHVQLFVLDYRRGYLGRDQVSWLAEALNNSSARFKIILSGTPFGVSTTGRETGGGGGGGSINFGDIPFAIDGGSDDIAGAAAKAAALVSASNGSMGAIGGQATVSMQLPPPIIALGWDDSGRVNLSLAAVIANYQLLCVKRKRESKEVEMDTSHDDTTYNDEGTHQGTLQGTQQVTSLQNGSQKDNINSIVDNMADMTLNENYNESSSSEVEIDSGILILSSGSCVPFLAPKPIERVEIIPEKTMRKSVNSNANTAPTSGVNTPKISETPRIKPIEWNKDDSEVYPFAASYDPIESGKPFCFELCVGGGMGIGGSSSVPLQPIALPSLGSNMLYIAPNSYRGDRSDNGNSEGNEGTQGIQSYSAVASLSDDGYSLDLKLLGLRESQEHSVLYRQKLRIPH